MRRRSRAAEWPRAFPLRVLGSLLLFVLTTGALRAEEGRPARRLTIAQGADAALAAWKAGDAAALGELAAMDAPDPWLVADELLGRGEHDAAEAFAKAASGKGGERLAEYLTGRRGKPDDPARRARLAAGNAARAAEKATEALEALGPPEAPPLEDALAIRLAQARGACLRALRRLSESRAAYLASAEAAERLGWLRYAAQAFLEAGASAHAGGEFPEARHASERALALFLERGDRLRASQALAHLGAIHQSLGDPGSALASYERALALREALGDKAGVAWTLRHLIAVHMALGDDAKALAALERVVPILEALGDRRGAAAARGDIGLFRFRQGDYLQALGATEQALAEMEALGDRAGAASQRVNLGNVHLELGDYPKALAVVGQALTEVEALGDPLAVAQCLHALGNIHGARGDHAEAVALLERAVAAQETLGNQRGAAAALSDLASQHHDRGEFARALASRERSLALLEAAGDALLAARTLGNQGVTYLALGDYAKALLVVERALAAQEALGDRAAAAISLVSLGNLHSALGDPARAIQAYERALATQETLGHRASAALTLGNLGTIHASAGDYERALPLFERALAEKEAIGDRRGVATTLGDLGGVQQGLGNPRKALALQERALAEKEAVGDQVGAGFTLISLGLAHSALGDPKAARTAFERAVRLARSLRALPLLVSGLRHLAELHLAAGASSRALAAAREALTAGETLLGGLAEEEGARARGTQATLYEVGSLAAAREEDPAEVCAFLESGRAGALLDVLGKRDVLRWKAETLPETLRTAEAQALARERDARAAYEKALGGGDRRERAEAARALDDALEEVREVNARIQREAKRAAGLFYPRAQTIEQIQASLEKGEALVLYGLCLGEALALIVEPEGERLVALGARPEIEAACAALDLRAPEGEPREALAHLQALLVAPLGFDEAVTRVLVSPEGPLCFLPWGAIWDRAVVVTPSGSTHALLRGEERDPGEGVLALGDPDYAGTEAGARALYYRGKPLAPLPSTRGEVEAIGTVRLLGPEASEDGLKAALAPGKRWRAVHLACHGLIDARRPGLSALALTRAGDGDGFLTALEVQRLDLPADLAVLSACETATGKLEGGEGIVGLTRSFMYAGTPRVICSLWKVDDEATGALMKRFYALWAPKDGTAGLPVAEALREAQAFVRGQERWSHPYYWAAWVLWGLP